MASPPAITFAIPYFSNLAYLGEAIDSVLAQTVSTWELLIVDDCGPEPADELVARLADPRIRLSRNATNLGLARNWNECFRQSNAPLVTLLHADDRLRPGYAATVLQSANYHGETAAFFTDTTIIGADGRRARSLPDFVKRFARRPRIDHDLQGDAALAAVLANNYIFCPTLCYRKSLIDADPFDASWTFVVDLDAITRLLLGGQTLRAIRSPLYEYRRHHLNQTSILTADATRFAEEIALYQQVAVESHRIGWQRSARTARHRLMVRTHLVLQVTGDLVRFRTGAAHTKWVMLWADLRHPRAARTR